MTTAIAALYLKPQFGLRAIEPDQEIRVDTDIVIVLDEYDQPDLEALGLDLKSTMLVPLVRSVESYGDPFEYVEGVPGITGVYHTVSATLEPQRLEACISAAKLCVWRNQRVLGTLVRVI